MIDGSGEAQPFPVVDGRLQYACARYGQAAFEEAHASLRRGSTSLRGIAGSGCEYISEAVWGSVASASTFADVDTPEDLHRLGLSNS